MYYAIGPNNCSNNNGGCSYLCLSSSKGRYCACPTGSQLTRDDNTCSEGWVSVLNKLISSLMHEYIDLFFVK